MRGADMELIIAVSTFAIVCALLAIFCAIKAHTAEVRAIAERSRPTTASAIADALNRQAGRAAR